MVVPHVHQTILLLRCSNMTTKNPIDFHHLRIRIDHVGVYLHDPAAKKT